MKKTIGPHWPRLTKEKMKVNYIAIDWNSYMDEDQEIEDQKEQKRLQEEKEKEKLTAGNL